MTDEHEHEHAYEHDYEKPHREGASACVLRATEACLVIAAVLLAACSETAPPPKPTFTLVFPPLTGDLMTISSPNVGDLNGDGVPDIVFGVGVQRVIPQRGQYVPTREPEIPGYVVAVSGASNQILWRVPHRGDAFTTPRFANLNGDEVPDVVMGGREGALSALNGADGATLWQVGPDQIAPTPVPYNFFTPALIRDANADGVTDLVVIYGGDDTRLPRDTREAGYLAVISGANGAPLAVVPVPDGKETYASPVVYQRADSSEWLIFGTGGEAHGGAAYRAPVSALLDGTFARRLQQLVTVGRKGVIAPPTLVELTGDGELDIVISSFDGSLIVLNGASGQPLWQRADPTEETYHSAAVVRLAAGKIGLFVSRGIGVFPKYVGSVHRLHDAADGRVLYQYRDPNYPGGAPLSVDLNGDEIDEPFFFSTLFPSAQGARIYTLNIPAGALLSHTVNSNFWSTPVIADARGQGSLELIGLGWQVGSNQGSSATAWRDLRWELLRLDLNAEVPALRAWGAYMGTGSDGVFRAR